VSAKTQVSKRKSSSPTELEEPPSTQLVLAAVDRAACHREREDVPGWEVLEHLHIPRRSRLARAVRSQLDTLQAQGLLSRSRLHGVPTWRLTDSGRRRLRRQRRLADRGPVLPESPQHRSWRSARTAAAQEIERFRRALAEGLADAAQLLDADPPAGSDAWFELGERLQGAAWRLGSASYCLREWLEPPEDRPDVEEQEGPAEKLLQPAALARLRARRAGRRNVGLWDEPDRR
jgi:hypothetical protein